MLLKEFISIIVKSATGETLNYDDYSIAIGTLCISGSFRDTPAPARQDSATLGSQKCLYEALHTGWDSVSIERHN